eukprot:6115026-Prymnesium_polylepis.1
MASRRSSCCGCRPSCRSRRARTRTSTAPRVSAARDLSGERGVFWVPLTVGSRAATLFGVPHTDMGTQSALCAHGTPAGAKFAPPPRRPPVRRAQSCSR